MIRKTYFFLTGLLFGVVGLFHLSRAFFHVEIDVGKWDVPFALSWLGGGMGRILGVWGLNLARD